MEDHIIPRCHKMKAFLPSLFSSVIIKLFSLLYFLGLHNCTHVDPKKEKRKKRGNRQCLHIGYCDLSHGGRMPYHHTSMVASNFLSFAG